MLPSFLEAVAGCQLSLTLTVGSVGLVLLRMRCMLSLNALTWLLSGMRFPTCSPASLVMMSMMPPLTVHLTFLHGSRMVTLGG